MNAKTINTSATVDVRALADPSLVSPAVVERLNQVCAAVAELIECGAKLDEAERSFQRTPTGATRAWRDAEAQRRAAWGDFRDALARCKGAQS